MFTSKEEVKDTFLCAHRSPATQERVPRVMVSDRCWSDCVRQPVKREAGQLRWREVALCRVASRLRGPGIWESWTHWGCQTHTHHASSSVRTVGFEWLCTYFYVCVCVCGQALHVWSVNLVCACSYLPARVLRVYVHKYCKYSSGANRFTSNQAKVVKTSKEKYWVSRSVQARDNASFHSNEGGAQGESAASHRPLIVPVLYSVGHNTGWFERRGKLSSAASSRAADVNTIFKTASGEERGKRS